MDEMIEKVKNGYTLNIYKDKLELSSAVFKFIRSNIIDTLKKKDRFKFCVSGGSTPKSVYKLLSKSDLRWDMVDVFLGDERCVDPNSELSNSLMLKNSLLTNFGSKAFFYEIFNDLNADDEAIKNQFISKLFERSVLEKALIFNGSGSILIVNNDVPNLLPLERVDVNLPKPFFFIKRSCLSRSSNLKILFLRLSLRTLLVMYFI